jgi:drug/metabolite transporter superfamily protein YnfA
MTQFPPMPIKAQKVRRPIIEWLPNVLLGILATAALVLSGWSMATLLHDSAGAPWWVAALGVGVFDVLALLAALLVKVHAPDPWRAAGAQIVMLLAVGASSAVNGAHGANLGGWTTALVFGAAPVVFEIAFAIKFRTLTVLIWLLFSRESMTRLKQEAWERIAIPVDSGAMTAVSGTPEAIQATVERLRSSGTRSKVQELYSSGITDPERMLAELPAGTNAESVKRYVREIRKEVTG